MWMESISCETEAIGLVFFEAGEVYEQNTSFVKKFKAESFTKTEMLELIVSVLSVKGSFVLGKGERGNLVKLSLGRDEVVRTKIDLAL